MITEQSWKVKIFFEPKNLQKLDSIPLIGSLLQMYVEVLSYRPGVVRPPSLFQS